MEKFTQRKDGKWMWSKEYRDTMRERLVWDTLPPDNLATDDWIWSWSHNASIGPKNIGKFDGHEGNGKIGALPLGDYTYPDKWWQTPQRLQTYCYVVLTEDEREFIKNNIL